MRFSISLDMVYSELSSRYRDSKSLQYIQSFISRFRITISAASKRVFASLVTILTCENNEYACIISSETPVNTVLGLALEGAAREHDETTHKTDTYLIASHLFPMRTFICKNFRKLFSWRTLPPKKK